MNIEIMVRVNSEYGTYAANVKVPDMLVKAFVPMSINDDPFFRLFDPMAISDTQAPMIITLRKNAAEDLSRILTEHIINAMEAEDTVNGYKININHD
jgi:hypothetical protein